MQFYIGKKTDIPLQLTTDLWNTTTPNKFHIWENAHIPRADIPPQLTIDLRNTTTPNQFHIWENAHIPRADVPHLLLINPACTEPYYTRTPPKVVPSSGQDQYYIITALHAVILCLPAAEVSHT